MGKNNDTVEKLGQVKEKEISNTSARELWVHEDNLINNRITWLGVSQGLLFAAYGISITRGKGALDTQLVMSIQKVIPWLGLCTSLLILIGVIAASIAMIIIKSKYDLEELGVSWITTSMGLICGAGMPIIFAIGWLYIMNEINLTLVASMLGGVGALLTGIAAIFVLPIQLGYKKKAEKSKEELDSYKLSYQLMMSIYKQYMASSEGIVWQSYPGKDDEIIINRIAEKTNLLPEQVKRMLDQIKTEGSI